MFRVCPLSSGSSGNALLLDSQNSSVLVDCGMSGKELERRLAEIKIPPEKIKGIVITHEHSDHISGAGIVSRRFNIPVYIRQKTYDSAVDKFGKAEIRFIDKTFTVSEFSFEAFPVAHDAADPIGLIAKKNNHRIGIITDTGCITALIQHKISGLDGLIIESNYDDKMLMQSDRPFFVKQRIKSRFGHLSNDDAVKVVDAIDTSRLKYLLLYHISEDHNSYELAEKKMGDYLKNNNLGNISLNLSYQSKTGKFFEM